MALSKARAVAVSPPRVLSLSVSVSSKGAVIPMASLLVTSSRPRMAIPLSKPMTTQVAASSNPQPIAAPYSGIAVPSASSNLGAPVPSSDVITVPSGSTDPTVVPTNSTVSPIIDQGSIQPGSSPGAGDPSLVFSSFPVQGGPVTVTTPVGTTQMSTPLAIGLGVGGGLLLGYILGKVF